MGIADFFRPKHRHSDVRVRSEAVKGLTSDDAAILVQVARTDRDIGVRRIALGKIDDASVLAELASEETERSLREYAGQRAAELWVSDACSDDADTANTAFSGILKLGDQRSLIDVVVRAKLPAVRKRAFGELRDPRALAELAKSEAPQELRISAIAQIDDGDVLRALAIDTTQKEVGLAAVDKIDDADRLENVAQKAKNKAVRQRARKIVGEIEEAERAKKPGVPDEVKRRRAEKAQLVREVEAVADSYDFAKAGEVVKAAQTAWAAIGGAPEDGDERFTKTVERFWKRKEIHEQTARSQDELRAIEREAQAAKAERVKEPPKEPVEPEKDDYVREMVPDPKREAREAEAKARREERDKQRAEDDARKQQQAAERAARTKEDAERSASIAASLKALCDDMEQLADSPQKDMRAIDRLLAQATKAFEQVGKVVATERDAVAERYRVARGKLVTKVAEMREAEDWQRWTNVPKAEALIQTAKEMVEAPATPDLGNRLRQLQALWKEVGPMPQRRSKELWEQFKATCDQVYDKVKGVRAVEQEKFVEVAKVKEALIAEAESVAESTDWAATAEKLKQLQASWKQSGYLPRKQGDELWKRFRAACDKFFERRKPVLDAQHAEEGENLTRKHALIARAQAVADGAPGEGGWGKSIAEIKNLQAQWKEIGFVPRREADAVYRAFRAACDALFAKRDAARDGEENAHRAELDAVRTEISEVMDAHGDSAEIVARALAVRGKARELGMFAGEVDQMVRVLVMSHAEALRGTELDPAAARNRRDKLIVRAEELLPKQAPAVSAEAAPVDIASQLKAAMRGNAFGGLRFSGRDPIEVIDELRALWLEAGPTFDDADRAQTAKFEATIARVLETVGPRPRDAASEERGDRGDRGERGERGRRRRRERHSGQQPIAAAEPIEPADVALAVPHATPLSAVPDAAASAVAMIEQPPVGPEIPVVASVPVATHDAITQPAHLPPEVPIGAVPSSPLPEPPRRKSLSELPPMDELDTGWDLGDEDPTAKPSEAAAAPETSTPSSSEMAGDGAVEGDGLDTGWD